MKNSCAHSAMTTNKSVKSVMAVWEMFASSKVLIIFLLPKRISWPPIKKKSSGSSRLILRRRFPQEANISWSFTHTRSTKKTLCAVRSAVCPHTTNTIRIPCKMNLFAETKWICSIWNPNCGQSCTPLWAHLPILKRGSIFLYQMCDLRTFTSLKMEKWNYCHLVFTKMTRLHIRDTSHRTKRHCYHQNNWSRSRQTLLVRIAIKWEQMSMPWAKRC